MFEIADQLCSPVGRPFRHIKGSEIEHDYIIDYFLGILNNDEFENPRESWEEFYFEDVKADNDLNALFLKNVSNIKSLTQLMYLGILTQLFKIEIRKSTKLTLSGSRKNKCI